MFKKTPLISILSLLVMTLSGCSTETKYQITWKNYNGDILEVDYLKEGELPTYDGDTPSKEGDKEYSYFFKGWTPKIEEVKKDIIYTAVFEEQINEYKVKWMNGDTLLGEETYKYGEMPEYKGEEPSKTDDTYSYYFRGWTPEIKKVEEDQIYHAKYEKIEKEITNIIEPLEMPIFRINTVDNTPITSKEEYLDGTLTIRNADNYDASNLTLGIRGRGNYSWSGTEKKSYRIKFTSKYQPLGQGNGPAKSWTLLAVHCDKSLLRTDAAFDFGRKLENLPFTSSSSFVELILNDKYDGVYELCDQIQVNKYRVNIDDTGEEADIGYLVELDKNASEDVISLSNGMTFELKSDYQNNAQMQYIKSYLEDCNDAIIGGNRETIESLIDIRSAVDAYLVEEIFKNLDVGWGSFYYTKPKGEKLKFGPVWDFDLSSGNADSDYSDSTFTSYRYTYVGNDAYYYYMQQHTWYLSLRETTWFNELIKERFFEIKDRIEDTINHISYMKETYLNSFNRNFTRWKIFNQKINREPNAIMRIKTFSGQVDYLVNWLNNRVNWLIDFYNGKVQDYTSSW